MKEGEQYLGSLCLNSLPLMVFSRYRSDTPTAPAAHPTISRRMVRENRVVYQRHLYTWLGGTRKEYDPEDMHENILHNPSTVKQRPVGRGRVSPGIVRNSLPGSEWNSGIKCSKCSYTSSCLFSKQPSEAVFLSPFPR